jgi:S-adenosylmethionine:diacylglycerol 3-amino-3-carboxypropyl transferase
VAGLIKKNDATFLNMGDIFTIHFTLNFSGQKQNVKDEVTSLFFSALCLQNGPELPQIKMKALYLSLKGGVVVLGLGFCFSLLLPYL